jgi:F-type H+-transporting ATPase subunit b
MNINATILGQAVAFILFVAFCMRYVWPPIIATVEKRQKEVSDTLINAETVRKEADSLKTNALEQLATAKREAKTIVEDAMKHRTKTLAGVKIESELERKRIIAKAEIDIAVYIEQARTELRNQVSSLVIMGAEKIIERSANEDTNKDLIDKIIAKI